MDSTTRGKAAAPEAEDAAVRGGRKFGAAALRYDRSRDAEALNA